MKTKTLYLLLMLLMPLASFAQWQSFPTNGLPDVNFVEGKNGAMYAGTSDGIYQFDGSSWNPVGTALSGLNVSVPDQFLIAANGDLYALPDTFLFKYSEGSWDTVTSSFRSGLFIEEMVTDTDTVLIRGAWDDGAQTIMRSADHGETWTEEAYGAKEDTNGAMDFYEDGLALNWGSRYIAKYFAQSSNGWIYTSSKDVVQMSKDGGDTWQWTRGDFASQNNDSPKGLAVRTYKGQEWLFKATSYSVGSTWTLGRTLVDDTVGLSWTRCGNSNGEGKPVGSDFFEDYKEDFFLYATGNGIHKSYDNGDNFFEFQSGLTESPSSMLVMGDSAYATVGNDIYLYNLGAEASWTTGPELQDTASTSVNLVTQTNVAGNVYYVVLPAEDPAPNKEQVILGQDGSGTNAFFKGNFEANYQTDDTTLIQSLSVSTSYSAYVVFRTEVLDTTAVEQLDFTTTSTPPVANKLVPNDGAVDVLMDAPVYVVFDQTINATDLSQIKVTDSQGGTVAVNPSINGDTLFVGNDELTMASEEYTVEVPTGTVENGDGVANESLISWSFTTVPAPLVDKLVPNDGAVDVLMDAPVYVVFDQQITAKDLSGIKVSDSQGSTVAVNPSVSSDTLFIGNDDLSLVLEEYTVEVPAGAVENGDAVANENLITWSFTTDDPNATETIEETGLTSVYPNPSNGQFIVEHNDLIKSVQLIDMDGKVVYQQDVNATSVNIDADLTSGKYILKVQADKTITKGVIIK